MDLDYILEELIPMNSKFLDRIEKHLHETCKPIVSNAIRIDIKNEYHNDFFDVHMWIRTHNDMGFFLDFECIRDGKHINVFIKDFIQPESMNDQIGEETYVEIVGLLEDEYNHVYL